MYTWVVSESRTPIRELGVLLYRASRLTPALVDYRRTNRVFIGTCLTIRNVQTTSDSIDLSPLRINEIFKHRRLRIFISDLTHDRPPNIKKKPKTQNRTNELYETALINSCF